MPRPRARVEPAAVTRAFAPDGIHGATSDAIAHAAGVAKPTLYARGGSKDRIFLACVEAEVERLLSSLAAADLATRGLPARARLGALATAVVEHGHANPAAARLLHVTARHTASTVAAEVEAALARPATRLAASLRADTTVACAERIAPALYGAAAALALTAGAPGPHTSAEANHAQRRGAMLGVAFASVLEPLGSDQAPADVQSIGLY